jgi:hypothetical protein
LNTFRKLVLFSCILYGSIANGQTVDDIISKHINAIGGKAVIDKITSQVTYSEVTVMGITSNTVTILVPGQGFKSVATVNGQEIIQCITPSGGWAINPLAGDIDAAPLPPEQVKAAQIVLQPGGELYNYKERGCKAELTGREKEQGVDIYKIKCTSSDGKQVSIFFIHPSTYYVIKRETINKVKGREITTTFVYTGHTKTDIGLVIPFTTVIDKAATTTAAVTKVEFNKPVDPKIFEMPK